MNQSSEWICKILLLQEFTGAEQANLHMAVGELDGIESERVMKCEAI